MYSTILSGALLGIRACMVQVEVDATSGLPSMSMVGSLGGEVRESRERVLAALKNAGID
ncbi:MAG: magnesium chelatase, partial [Lachnospiraceae bacterium]|nr:magnesium chelatase [Lachnospiraceae bacterium]